MDTETARTLCKLNDEFYRRQAASFSETRRSPWTGWRRCAAAMERMLQSPDISVLDLACGNRRFESFLTEEYPRIAFRFYTVDNCEGLVQAETSTHDGAFQNLDIMGTLLDGRDLAQAIDAPLCDLSVAFGFMHHVPGADRRREVFSALLDKTKPGGYVAVSFWQFMKSETLARRARETTAAAMGRLDLPPLEADDYLLGWQDIPDACRYCHNFDKAQIDELLASVAPRVEVVDRFEADGRGGNLNAYAVLRVLPTR